MTDSVSVMGGMPLKALPVLIVFAEIDTDL